MVSTLKEPRVQVTVGPLVTPTLSVAVRVTAAVPPEITVTLAGLKDTTGGTASGASGAVMETVSVAVPAFPAASEAVAVHVASVSVLRTGAV